jgi:hypothetical protein
LAGRVTIVLVVENSSALADELDRFLGSLQSSPESRDGAAARTVELMIRDMVDVWSTLEIGDGVLDGTSVLGEEVTELLKAGYGLFSSKHDGVALHSV